MDFNVSPYTSLGVVEAHERISAMSFSFADLANKIKAFAGIVPLGKHGHTEFALPSVDFL